MLEKSKLLTYILECAEMQRAEDKKKTLSANHFMLSILNVLWADENDQLPDKLSEPEYASEMLQITQIMSQYSLNIAIVIEQIKKEIHAEKYTSFMDEMLFSKIMMSAETQAQSLEKKFLSADTLLQMLLKEPTAAIKKCVIDRAANKGETAESEFGKITSETDDLLSGFGGRKNATESETDENRQAAEKDLSQLVEKVKSIQQTLLATVYGQDQAVNTFAEGYFQSELLAMKQKSRRKPRATFLFAGAPGVGKTFLAEQAASQLSLPFRRFDMSEYCEKESNFEFCGMNSAYKSAKEGNVTGFVAKNHKCVLLFDEIEKAHSVVINLFLQILDAGRLRDVYTEEEVSFEETIIIFTTNAGKKLYENASGDSLAGISKKALVKALADDVNPLTNAPFFPMAICSRLAAGNVVMFNHLGANNLLKIAQKELDTQIADFAEGTGIKVSVSPLIAPAILFSEGGKADARTVKGRTTTFFHTEIYELLRLLPQSKIKKIKAVSIDAFLPEDNVEIRNLFSNSHPSGMLIFAEEHVVEKCRVNVPDVNIYSASAVEDAKEILFNNDITLILCDPLCGAAEKAGKVLNLEDVESSGKEFLAYAKERYDTPLYILETDERKISWEETVSFVQNGAQGVLSIATKQAGHFAKEIGEICSTAYLQGNLLKLSKMNKVLSYNTVQTISKSGKNATIELYGFSLTLSVDADDVGSIVGNMSKPSIHFADVIGAEDAKDELRYFVDYLKDPIRFVRKGVKAPKGILLYGPPGTGKTMLAKAMAGESDVTFIAAEGNQFLKKFVGEGSESVHELFGVARKYAPSILFIDEIDAIGRDRNSSSPTADSSADVLTSFLTEMDGFHSDVNKPVFVLAATNFSVERGTEKSLDPALLRRFDRRIYVDLPNTAEREKYIRLKISKNANVKLTDEFIGNLSMRSAGMSLAELESVIELALRNSIKAHNNIVDDGVMEEAFESFSNGEEKKWDADLLRRTAIHESGHALICWSTGELPTYLTIVARGNHGGYMQHATEEGKAVYTKAELLGKIRTALGGRAAELVYFGKEDGLSTGPSGDLQSATLLAKQLICNYGMEESFGLVSIAPSEIEGQLAVEIRKHIGELLMKELNVAIQYISENKCVIDRLVSELLSKNHLKGDEMKQIFESLNAPSCYAEKSATKINI